MDGVDSSAASKNVFHMSVDFDPYFLVKLLTSVAINTNADLITYGRKRYKYLETNAFWIRTYFGLTMSFLKY